MKHTFKHHVFMSLQYGSDYQTKTWRPQVWYVKIDESANLVYIGEQELTVEVPNDFDPVPRQVAALEAEKLKALEAYQKSVADINRRLSELQALEA